jgi:type VI secretion system protein ImpL
MRTQFQYGNRLKFNKQRKKNKMLSYISLILSSCGIVWTGWICSKLLITRQRESKSFIKKIKEYLTPFKYKIFANDSLEHSFSSALKSLHEFLPDKNSLYFLPWYMAIGRNDCGKSAFFNNVKLDKYIDSNNSNNHTLCNWHFFNHAVFLDINGDLIRRNDVLEPSSDEKNWFKTLNLLNKTRKEKPLDGLIVFFSIHDVLDCNNNMANISQDAEYIYMKLWQIQEILHMRLPIYIIFTHLDEIEGFRDLADSIPESCLQNMFGWSNAYSVDTQFQNYWMDTMFASINEQFEELKSEICIRTSPDKCAKILKFFYQFNQLKSGIRLYVERLFQTNQYAESNFLRGVYFTGMSNTSDTSNTTTLPQLDDAISNRNTQSNTKYAFSTDIMNKRIFLEKNIAKYVTGINYNYKNTLKKLNVFTIATCIICSLLLYRFNQQMIEAKNTLIPRITQVSNITNKKQHFPNDVINAATTLIEVIKSTSDLSLFFITVPATWFSKLQQTFVNFLTNANDIIFIDALAAKIELQYKDLANYNFAEFIGTEQITINNPLEHPAYDALRKFIDALYTVKQNEYRLKSVIENGNLDNLLHLIQSLFEINLPKNFYSQSSKFTQSLKKRGVSFTKYTSYDQPLKNNLKKIFAIFNKQAFALENYFSKLDEMASILSDLERNYTSFISNNLFALQAGITDAISFVNNDTTSAWLHKNHFYMHKFEQEILDKIEKMFDKNFKTSLRETVNEKYLRLKKQILNSTLPIIGKAFYSIEENRIKISNGLLKLHGILNNVFLEPFMQSFEQQRLPEDFQTLIVWDPIILAETAKIIEQYNEFITKKIHNYPTNMHNMLRRIAKTNVVDLIETKLALALLPVAGNDNDAKITFIANSINTNHENLCFVLNNLFALDSNLFFTMKEIEKKRLLFAIEEVDMQSSQKKWYEIDQGKITMLHLTGFKQYIENVPEFLTVNRNKIINFITMIKPIINLIKFLEKFDPSIITPTVKKIITIQKDIDNDITESSSSALSKLEKFIKEQMDVLTPETLKNIVLTNPLLTQSDSYFIQKLIDIKKQLYKKTMSFIEHIFDEHYNKCLFFFRKYREYFPFTQIGKTIPGTAYNELQPILQNKTDQLSIVFRICPKIQHEHMNFIDNFEIMIRFIHFLIQEGSIITMTIKEPDKSSSTLNQNLEHLMAPTVSIDHTTITFPQTGTLQISNYITFEFTLVNQSTMSFAIHDDKYRVNDNKATLTLDKKGFVSLIINNMIIKNNVQYIIFKLPLIDKYTGKRIDVVYELPVMLTINGENVILPNGPLVINEENLSNTSKSKAEE